MKHILTILALGMVLPATAMAAPPAAKPAPPAAAPHSLSPEGKAIAAKVLGTQDPRLAQIPGEMTAIRQEKAKYLEGPTVDVDKLEQVLRREEALQSEYNSRRNDVLLALLRALPDPDRLALLQDAANRSKPQSVKPVETGR